MLNTQCDEARRQSCEVALKALVSIYRNVRHFAKQHALQSGHLFRWLVELPADFMLMQLCQSRTSTITRMESPLLARYSHGSG
ncbi:hypothetical protein KC337_g57 [Hortaea werneckii]|nr:hypothetical protein KC337_g57 [Hortaea werneckii]